MQVLQIRAFPFIMRAMKASTSANAISMPAEGWQWSAKLESILATRARGIMRPAEEGPRMPSPCLLCASFSTVGRGGAPAPRVRISLRTTATTSNYRAAVFPWRGSK